ncbi:MAG: FKBP-type peptidyl-prolyl cis-trans isomerase [Saprospiraceae bacterium]
MQNYFILFLVAVLSVTACQNAEEARTTSGYKYEFHSDVSGTPAKFGDYVSFHVQMRNDQDSIIFKSRDGAQVPQMQVPEPPTDDNQARRISPIAEVLPLMSIGDSLTLYYPIDTLPQKPRNFENSNNVIYDIVLTEIMDEEQFKAQQDSMRVVMEAERVKVQAREAEVGAATSQRAKEYAAGKLDGEIQTTASGLKYIIHEEGTGKQAEAGKQVAVSYYGTLTDGTMFDNSFKRGTTFPFPLGQGRVIRGWDEGVALLKVGSKATLFIPSDLGYGEAGSPPTIPGGAELVFYIEVEDVM